MREEEYVCKDVYKEALRIILSSCQHSIESNGTTRRKCDSNGSYHFIPKSTHRATSALLEVAKYINQGSRVGRKSFLDAGCGIGNILALAKVIGFGTCTGLEFDEETIKIARVITKDYATIMKYDIMTYKKYNKYDVIYFFRPFCDPKKQIMFEGHIYNSMKVGAIVLPMYKQYHRLNIDKRFEPVTSLHSDSAFIKVKKGNTALKLSERW